MESELLAWLRNRLRAHPRLRLGPGDDAALLELGKRRECLVTVDLLSDGVDFELARVDPRRVGRKALAVNLSDIAAMAGRPLGAVVALLLPRQGGLELAQQLYEGMLPLAEQFDVPIAGGDINSWDGRLVISITVLGQPTERGPLLRSGARPGDKIVVSGEFGGSILGHHFDFTPRIAEALLLHKRYDLHAGMDVSDGLSLDLARLCQESGCGAVIETIAIPISYAAIQLAEMRNSDPLVHALSDGEDFELLLAVPPDDADRMCREQPIAARVSIIGEFIDKPGLWERSADGASETPLQPRGYMH